MELRLSAAMPHRTQQTRIDSGEPCQRPGIESIIFSATFADQPHVPRMRHDHFVPHLGQLPADPGRMRPGFQCDPTARNLAEDLLDCFRCGRQVLFQKHVSRFIQNAVMAGTISQVQTDGQSGLLENLVSVFRHGAILFHKPVSFSLCLERVESLGAYRIPSETGLLIPSVKRDYRNVAQGAEAVTAVAAETAVFSGRSYRNARLGVGK